MKLLWKELTLLFLEQYLRYGSNENDQMKPEFKMLLKTFLLIATHQMTPFGKNGSNWGPRSYYKKASFYQIHKSLHEPADNNSNTINTTPTVSLLNNTPVPKWRNWRLLTRNFKTLRKSLQFNPIVRNQTLTTSLIYYLSQDTIPKLKKELINKENAINHLWIILKKIPSNTYNISPSNKESGNELILENNADHIDSKNEIVHELLDVEFEHLQRRYQHFIDQSPNQPEQTVSNDQCSNGSNVTKECKVIESKIQNQELNKVTPTLNQVLSCEEQLTEIR